MKHYFIHIYNSEDGTCWDNYQAYAESYNENLDAAILDEIDNCNSEYNYDNDEDIENSWNYTVEDCDEAEDLHLPMIYDERLKLIDIWSPTCGPCKQLSPILNQLAKEYPIKLEEVNIEIDPIDNYQVRNVPTVIFYKQNKEVDRFTGFRTKNDIIKYIEKYI